MEVATGLNDGMSVSHGRACINCVKAKARCTTSIDGAGKCERCHRMNKDCQPSPAVRRRRVAKKPSNTKTAQLEEKLDGLVSLLRSQSQPSRTGQATNHILGGPLINTFPDVLPPLDSRPHVNPATNLGYTSSSHFINTQTPAPTPPGSWPSNRSPTSSNSPPVWEPSADTAEECLDRFRNHFTKFLPFVVIPRSSTPTEIKECRPFLWHSILTICIRDSVRQKILAKEFRAMIGREAFVESTRSLDLLLSILVFSAWDQHHCFDKPIMANLVQLAMALVYDLGINKPPLNRPQNVILGYDTQGCPKPKLLLSTGAPDERRALLGCFIVSSLTSCYFQKGEALRWTAYTEECCNFLLEKKDEPTDAWLVQLVRFRRITDRATHSPWHDSLGDTVTTAKPPAAFYVTAMEAQILDIKLKVPLELQQCALVLLELYNTELTVYEVALSRAPNLSNDQEFPRLEYLHACLRNIKSWFELFLTFPAESYFGLPLTVYSQMAHCTICLYRLTTFECPEWDLDLVRKTTDPSAILTKLLKGLRSVKDVVGLDIGTTEHIDSFYLTAQKLGAIKTWWEAKIAVDAMGPINAPVSEGISDMPMDFMDEEWLKDIMGPWENNDPQYTEAFGSRVNQGDENQHVYAPLLSNLN